MKRAYGIALGAIGLIGLGAGLMYFLDPTSGARRRTMTRERTRDAYRTTSGYLHRTPGRMAMAGADTAGLAAETPAALHR